MIQTNQTKETRRRNKLIAQAAKAVEWVVEHPDAPLDPMLREFVNAIMEGVGKEEKDAAEEAEITG